MHLASTIGRSPEQTPIARGHVPISDPALRQGVVADVAPLLVIPHETAVTPRVDGSYRLGRVGLGVLEAMARGEVRDSFIGRAPVITIPRKPVSAPNQGSSFHESMVKKGDEARQRNLRAVSRLEEKIKEQDRKTWEEQDAFEASFTAEGVARKHARKAKKAEASKAKFAERLEKVDQAHSFRAKIGSVALKGLVHLQGKRQKYHKGRADFYNFAAENGFDIVVGDDYPQARTAYKRHKREQEAKPSH